MTTTQNLIDALTADVDTTLNSDILNAWPAADQHLRARIVFMTEATANTLTPDALFSGIVDGALDDDGDRMLDVSREQYIGWLRTHA